MLYVGDGWAVDADAFTVERDGEFEALEPQAIDVLLHLLDHRDRLVTKIELLDEVWGDQFVSESALTTRIKQVRRALGDDGKRQDVIQTVHGRGYRFVAEVDERPSPSRDDVAGSGDDGRVVTETSTPARRPPSGADIPVARSGIVGRERLVTELVETVHRERLTSLVGLGGVGKTTLAGEIARRSSDLHADGVGFVDLVPVATDGDVAVSIASALGLAVAQAGPVDVAAELTDHDMLLVLDNCEHVVDGVAELCDALLDRAPDVRVLATSRVPLGVVGERRSAIGPLPVVSPDGGAIDLLDAVATRWGAEIPAEHRTSAITLCARIDGLPLAVELVGARLGTMSVPDVVARLDTLVDSDSRDRRHDRQASLGAVINDTLDALDERETRLVEVLGRLSGPFGLDDVETIADTAAIDDPVLVLAGLVDRSLVTRAPSAPASGRYRVLETVRQHVHSRDPARDATDDVHAAWCLGAVGDSVLRHHHDLDLAGWISRRYADVLTAERHLVARDRPEDAARIRTSTSLMMHVDDGPRAAQGLALVDERLTAVGTSELVTRLHCTGVLAAMAARRPDAMFEHGQLAVENADTTDDPSLRAQARILRTWSGVVVDPAQAFTDLDEAIELARGAEDERTEILAVGYKAANLAMARQFETAVELARDAVGRSDGLIDYPTQVAAQVLTTCQILDDPAAALALDDEVRRHASVSSPWGMDVTRQCLNASLGRTGVAHGALVDLAGRLRREGVDPFPDVLLPPAVAALVRGDDERSARYLGAIRHADRPTQSLMVSTAYRLLTSRARPADADSLGAAPRAIAEDALEWLGSLEPSGTVDAATST